MHSEISNYLRLCDISEDTSILTTKDFISDMNFICSEILVHFLKNNYSVILINFAQSFAHYNHILLKSGVNVRQLRENERFIIVDGLSEIEKLTSLIPCETEQNTCFRALFSDVEGAECSKQFYLYIKTLVEKLIDESKQFVLFLDDISVLLNLGLSFNTVALFVQYCRSLCNNKKVTPNVLLIGSTHENKDPENDKIVNYLLHLVDISIQVEGLKTGYSKDAHGKITLNKRNRLENFCHEKLLFKISEKGTKLLTSGL